MNIKDQIANARDVKVKAVEVPEWSCTAYIKELSVKDRLALAEQIDNAHYGKLGVFVLLNTLCDQDGNLVFGQGDYDILAAKNVKVVDRLAKVAFDLNGMMGGAVEDAKKN